MWENYEMNAVRRTRAHVAPIDNLCITTIELGCLCFQMRHDPNGQEQYRSLSKDFEGMKRACRIMMAGGEYSNMVDQYVDMLSGDSVGGAYDNKAA